MPASGQDTDQLHRSNDAFYRSDPGIASGVVDADFRLRQAGLGAHELFFRRDVNPWPLTVASPDKDTRPGCTGNAGRLVA
jgi:hypothetical protein